MDPNSVDILYLGFLLPVLFSITLVAEGIYRVYRKEGGVFNVILGILILLGLALFYVFISRK